MSPHAQAVDEGRVDAFFAHDAQALVAAATAGTLSGKDGVPLAWRAFTRSGAHATIVLIGGYTETFLKYLELIHDFNGAGYDVYALDHRGMGLSGRMLPNPQIVHVEQFNDYADDLQSFVETVVRPRAKGDVYLFAHSMGGLVGTIAMAQAPGLFKAAVLSSPLFTMDTGSHSEMVSYLAVSFNVMRGAGRSYAPGYTDWDPNAADPAKNRVTHSMIRYKHQLDLFKRVALSCMGGPTNLWVRNTLKATWQRKALAEKVKTPVLLFQAAEDLYARPEGQTEFCAKAAHCRLVRVAGAKHEIFQEVDAVRAPVLQQALDFFR